MFSLKKSFYYALAIFLLAIVVLGIKIVVDPQFGMVDLNIFITEVITFIFAVAILVNIKIKDTLKVKPMWITAVVCSGLSILLWGYIINIAPTILTISLFPYAMLTTVLAFTFTNFGIVNLAERSHFFAPVFIFITKLACLICAIYLIIVILGWYQDLEFTIRSLLISFFILSYCNFMIVMLHVLGLRKKSNNLVLIPTATKGVFIDKVGKQYLVQELDKREDKA